MLKENIETNDGREILVREVKSSDFKEIVNFNRRVIRQKTDTISRKRSPAIEEEKKRIGSILKDVRRKRTLFLVCKFNGKIIGSSFMTRSRKERKKHIVYFGIAIDRNFRFLGIGKKVIKIMIKEVKKRMKGARLIHLEVFSYNKAAIKIYKYLGFEKIATLPKAVKNKGRYYDSYIMYYYLR